MGPAKLLAREQGGGAAPRPYVAPASMARRRSACRPGAGPCWAGRGFLEAPIWGERPG